ncbi:Pollen Ole e 1 allergen and extensin family protein [Forsythia ovata]|uniref:Pollen Ole e 1 allergen and extensin family protein n=1 Tax=Forsythia ovata TaxID=205694 RepID=A0ABD1QBH7_9LAMI
MMSHFHDRATIVKMIYLALLSFFCLGTPAAARWQSGILELSGREDLAIWGGYGEEKLSRVLISGKILCHVNRHDKAPFRSYYISGAQVAVICNTSGKTRKIWAKGTADWYGEFLIELPSHLHAIHNLENICRVKVFHLPKNSACRQGKHEKIKLASTGDGIRIYTTHKIHLMSKLSEACINEAAKPNEMVNNL